MCAAGTIRACRPCGACGGGGVPPAAVRDFIRRVGVARADNLVEPALLDHCIREYLNKNAVRRMAILRPLKVVLVNYPEGDTETLQAINNPEDEAAGRRNVPFGRELYIERGDFMEDPPKKFFRLAPGREVRLRYAYFITCREAIKDAGGEVIELRCTYDPATRGGDAPDGRRVKGTLHWVAAAHAIPAQVRLYEHLFAAPEPGADGDFLEDLNPASLEVLEGCRLEPALAEAKVGDALQFERQGYFAKDSDSRADGLVFNRTVGLRDSWAKLQARTK